MKKFFALLLTLVMSLSVMAFPAFAMSYDDSMTTTTSSQETLFLIPMSSDDRNLLEFRAQSINVFASYPIKPNKGWSLRVILGSVDYSFRIEIKNSVGKSVWNGVVPAGGTINQKVVSSCDGGTYYVELWYNDSNHMTFKVAGGVNQNEFA